MIRHSNFVIRISLCYPPSSILHPRLSILLVLLLAAATFFTGIAWGLPSSASDKYLFGSHPIWTGQQILNLAGPWDESENRGSDIAMHPLAKGDQPILLNETDAQRAQIVRRYRLYSCQPDEMITFRALSRMKPRHLDFDPQFFQYGGLWVYPVGILLKIASMLRLITLNSDVTWYLDHPEQFGRFYVVARCYCAVWGLLGVLIVYAIGKEWTGKSFVGILAALFYATTPVVVNAAHEAKPHLPGAVLILAAVWTAMRFVRTGKPRFSILTAVLCGAAFGMVLTGIAAFAVVPMMVFLRPMRWAQRLRICISAAAIGLAVFLAANPYLPIDYLFHRQIVQSNVGNYGNFYHLKSSVGAMENAIRLIGEGMTIPLAVAAAVALIAFSLRNKVDLGSLLLAPAALLAVPFVLAANDKSAEYARFALMLDVALVLAVAAALTQVPTAAFRTIIVAGLLAWSTFRAGVYDFGFQASAAYRSTRESAAEQLSVLNIIVGATHGAPILATWAEPAPYCLPPCDLFDWQIMLLPPGDAGVGSSLVTIRPIDNSDIFQSPISWANKPFVITRSVTR